MYAFSCDYMQGAHPAILEALCRTNLEPLPGYGEDIYCQSAKEKIKAACGCEGAAVQLLVGGTQTNRVLIDSLLTRYEGVIACDTGHVAVHEAGAIESSGHKVLTIPHVDGKLTAEGVRAWLEAFYADESHEHMVQPGMVYISHPTELGSLYSLSELEALSEVCRAYGLPLMLDGARLGYGLYGDGTDLSLKDIARLTDVFYIGGTKVGALCGEAVVFPRGNMPKHFVTSVKQNGALLAKGRLLGVQFDTLFTDDLYFRIGKHGADMARRLKQVLVEKGCRIFIDSPSNQQFIVADRALLQRLSGKVAYGFWEKLDEEHTAIRLATSWATTEEDIEGLAALL